MKVAKISFKSLVLSILLLISNSLVEAQKYFDYKQYDIYRGVPVKIARQWPVVELDDVMYFTDGKLVIKPEYNFTDSDQTYDSKGHLIRKVFGPNYSVNYEWFDGTDFIKKETFIKDGKRTWWLYIYDSNFVWYIQTDSDRLHFVYEEFDSYGNWIKRFNQGHEETRQIEYQTPRQNNYLTVTNGVEPLSNVQLNIISKTGRNLMFIRGFVSDKNGKFKNLPYRPGIKYRLSSFGYNTVEVDGSNPNQTVVMERK